jgi:hypothetical protein
MITNELFGFHLVNKTTLGTKGKAVWKVQVLCLCILVLLSGIHRYGVSISHFKKVYELI